MTKTSTRKRTPTPAPSAPSSIGEEETKVPEVKKKEEEIKVPEVKMKVETKTADQAQKITGKRPKTPAKKRITRKRTPTPVPSKIRVTWRSKTPTKKRESS